MRHPHYQKPAISRRDMLRTCGCGFGGLALSSLLQRDLLATQCLAMVRLSGSELLYFLVIDDFLQVN